MESNPCTMQSYVRDKPTLMDSLKSHFPNELQQGPSSLFTLWAWVLGATMERLPGDRVNHKIVVTGAWPITNGGGTKHCEFQSQASSCDKRQLLPNGASCKGQNFRTPLKHHLLQGGRGKPGSAPCFTKPVQFQFLKRGSTLSSY